MVQNREWKTFQKRWSSSGRLTGFLFWSLLVHFVVVMLAGIPAHRAYIQKKKLQTERNLKELERQQEVDEVIEEAEKELRNKVKVEVGVKELKEFYEEITEGFIDEKLREQYWEELLKEPDEELDKLAGLLAETEEFEPLKRRSFSVR